MVPPRCCERTQHRGEEQSSRALIPRIRCACRWAGAHAQPGRHTSPRIRSRQVRPLSTRYLAKTSLPFLAATPSGHVGQSSDLPREGGVAVERHTRRPFRLELVILILGRATTVPSVWVKTKGSFRLLRSGEDAVRGHLTTRPGTESWSH